MYLPKVREIKEALTSFFSAPYTTKFPASPYEPEKGYRGKPRYNEDICIGCGTCSQVCPPNAITIIDDKESLKRTLQVDYCSCIQCGQCEEHCITEKGIVCTNEYSFATFSLTAPEMYEKVEKEIVICECCGEVIACSDHLLWIKHRLGAKAYSHPNFLLETQKLFNPPAESGLKANFRREDQIKSVCAKCRNKVVVVDEF